MFLLEYSSEQYVESQTLQDLKNVVNANKDLKKEVEDGINGVGAFADTGLKKVIHDSNNVFLSFSSSHL